VADFKKSVAENVAGDFFVDSTCIDCDTCRQLAPASFGETGSSAFVHHQPVSTKERQQALQALVCCPTGSIGTRGSGRPREALDNFPLLLEEPVYFCGFNSPKSYGGNSYFIRHPDGNWLIDSPKYLPRLVNQFRALGGISKVFLTHRDDVADADRYAREFGSERIIHRLELSSQPDAELVLEGFEPIELAPGFVAIPTPGHTAGHCVLLFNNRFLFTGDHLEFDRDTQQLAASRDYCWHSWPKQIESMRKLAEHRFAWVLPGHGQRVELPVPEMRRQMLTLVAQMQSRH
jgi:glyoxylase-like metal-dependent hydrolase (beta-lactamase superfamily II)/ferredoxin